MKKKRPVLTLGSILTLCLTAASWAAASAFAARAAAGAAYSASAASWAAAAAVSAAAAAMSACSSAGNNNPFTHLQLLSSDFYPFFYFY